ncbi:hypothetical protein [Neobacillus drentensis]|uniref:hypothetical protein n=1 Tax=Neobacillus drentensis TaxID=220684 RepID=UPI002FFFA539
MEDGLNVITIEGDRVVEESWKGGLYSSEEPVKKRFRYKQSLTIIGEIAFMGKWLFGLGKTNNLINC